MLKSINLVTKTRQDDVKKRKKNIQKLSVLPKELFGEYRNHPRKMYILQKHLHLQSPLSEVNQAMIARSY